jgi:hypothetical protein
VDGGCEQKEDISRVARVERKNRTRPNLAALNVALVQATSFYQSLRNLIFKKWSVRGTHAIDYLHDMPSFSSAQPLPLQQQCKPLVARV